MKKGTVCMGKRGTAAAAAVMSLCLVITVLCGCGSQNAKDAAADSDADDVFICGMDASSVLAEENSGVIYYDYDGREQDVFRTMADAASIISACGCGMILMMKTETDTAAETMMSIRPLFWESGRQTAE